MSDVALVVGREGAALRADLVVPKEERAALTVGDYAGSQDGLRDCAREGEIGVGSDRIVFLAGEKGRPRVQRRENGRAAGRYANQVGRLLERGAAEEGKVHRSCPAK